MKRLNFLGLKTGKRRAQKLRVVLAIFEIMLFSIFTITGALISSALNPNPAQAVTSPLFWGTPEPVPTSYGYNSAIVWTDLSCVSSTFCMLVGGNTVSRWNGAYWSEPVAIEPARSINSSYNDVNLVSVSCATSSFCVTVDNFGNELTWNGIKWSASQLIDPSGGELSSVSCATSSFCVAVDSLGNVLTWNGTTWNMSQPFTSLGGGIATVVSCSQANFCMAIGTGGFYWNGSTWNSLPWADSTVTSLSCVSSAFCVEVNPSGPVFLNEKGDFAGYFVNGAPISRVSCASATYCEFVGDSFYNGYWNGSTFWYPSYNPPPKKPPPPPTDFVAGLSCVASNLCTEVSSENSYPDYFTSYWDLFNSATGPNFGGGPPIPQSGYTSTSCLSSNFCMAVDDQGNVTSWNGTSWSTPQLIDSNENLISVSCVSVTFCMAVDSLGNAFLYNISSWSGIYNIDQNQDLTSVSCAATDFCVAVDILGNELTWNGTSWSVPQSIDASNTLTSVSCVSVDFCMAIDILGNELTWNGTSWSAPQSIDTTSNTLTSVSCTTFSASNYCVVVPTYGSPLFFNGTSWSYPTSNSLEQLTSVSCVSYLYDTPFCVAVDANEEITMTPAPLPTVTSVYVDQGPITGGTQVTITGTNFYIPTPLNNYSGTTTVAFDNIPATNVKVISTTTITATSPPAYDVNLPSLSPQVYDVNVTIPSGTSNATPADRFTYLPPTVKYFPMNQTRIVDTRSNSGYTGAGNPLNPTSPKLQLALLGDYGVPTNATAVALNVTVTNTTSSGYLVVYPDGTNLPDSSNLNWQQNQTVANLVQVNIGADGKVDFYNAIGTTDLIVDLEGYYAPSVQSGGLYVPITPVRAADTRPGSGLWDQGATFSPGGTLTVYLTGGNGVPTTASAAVINVTVTNTTGPGFLSVTCNTQSNTSNLNWSGANQTVSNRVIEPCGTGVVSINISSGSANVIVDVEGYFSDPTSNGSGVSFTGVNPVRIADTRPGSGLWDQNSTLLPGGTMTVYLTGENGVPTTATAAVINVTVTDTTAVGYLSITPTGATSTSDVNWMGPNSTVANLDIATLNSGGSIIITNESSGSVDIILDLFGYMS